MEINVCCRSQLSPSEPAGQGSCLPTGLREPFLNVVKKLYCGSLRPLLLCVTRRGSASNWWSCQRLGCFIPCIDSFGFSWASQVAFEETSGLCELKLPVSPLTEGIVVASPEADKSWSSTRLLGLIELQSRPSCRPNHTIVYGAGIAKYQGAMSY